MDTAAAYAEAQAPWHLGAEAHWPGQQCVVAMVVPASHFQGTLPPGAILLPANASFPGTEHFGGMVGVPAEQFGCSFPGLERFGGMVGVPAEQFDCSFQGSSQQAQDTMTFQPSHPDWTMQPSTLYQIDNTDRGLCPPTEYHGIGDESIENTTLGSSSDDGDEDNDLSSEVSASRPRINPSAARRLRRKKAADNSSQVGKAIPGKVAVPAAPAVPTAASRNARPAKDFSGDYYEELRFKLTEGGKQGVEDALAAIQGQVWKMSCDPVGCRLVQLALEASSQQEAARVASELHGHVLEAAASPHANYVIQKVVTQLTFNAARFVAVELRGACIRIAQHRFGCRILCRLLEYCGTQRLVLRLVDELLHGTEDLCCDCFAHHVIQSVLEHGSDRHRRRIAAALLRDPLENAKHKHTSYLIERALCCCCLEDKEALLATLSHPRIIADLVCCQSGCYVARALLQLDEVDSQAALAEIRLRSPELQNLKHYKRLMADLELAAAVRYAS